MATRSRTQTPARRKPPARPGTRHAPPRKGSGLPSLQQHHKDLIGLGLVGAAVFFAFVVWLHWDGGRLGKGAVDGLEWLVGGVHVVVPVVCMAAGAVLILRPVLPAVRPV